MHSHLFQEHRAKSVVLYDLPNFVAKLLGKFALVM